MSVVPLFSIVCSEKGKEQNIFGVMNIVNRIILLLKFLNFVRFFNDFQSNVSLYQNKKRIARQCYFIMKPEENTIEKRISFGL